MSSGEVGLPESTNVMQAPLPVITTPRLDSKDRGYLAWVAVAHEVAHLPLDSAPIDASPHALEIHADGFTEPLVVIAEPVGAPTDEGFPLRLHPLDDAQAAQLRAELFGAGAPAAEPEPAAPPRRSVASVVPPRLDSEPPPPLSEGHAQSLAREPLSQRRSPGSLAGRVLGDGRFALEALIGTGASGEVYRAMHTTLRRAIAVKVLHPALQQSQDYCARFYSEALAASQLDHRNVMRVIDYGQEPDGLLYIVMELLEGESLQQILDREGALPLDRLVHLVAQACAGLAHAHDAGVVHRDIKPENIVVVRRRDDEGSIVELVKVCDFGIAHWSPLGDDRQIGEDDATMIDQPDGSKVVGTPAYMAPEQIRNEAIDARADVYALGIVLYELATGRLPFDAERPMDLVLQHLQRKPTPPRLLEPDMDPELERIIMTALEKDPGRRQANARVLRADLRELVDDDWSAGTGQVRRVSIRNIPTAADFLASPSDGIARLATADDRTRPSMLDAAAEAIRAAIAAGNMRTARDLAAYMQIRSTDMNVRPEEREQMDRALRVLRDPQTMSVLAGHLLDAKIPRVEDAAPLLVAGGPVSARALVDARRSMPPSLDLRSRFVGAMRIVGPPALPVIVAALEPLAPLVTRAEEALAEDLLHAMPDTRSETAGEVTVRFVRLDKPNVGVLALAATTTVWGRRAQPLLLGVLDRPVDATRLAAMRQLERLGAIDDFAVERLTRIVTTDGAEETRVAAASSLAWATPESRARAAQFVRQRLAPQGIVGSVLHALGKHEPAALVVALVRSLCTLDLPAGHAAIERLSSARAELRPELERIRASFTSRRG